VSDADAFDMARRVTHEEGMLIGGSGGTAVVAALRVAETAPAGSCVVVLVPDTGRGYISKIFNDDWMRGYGFLTTESGPTAGTSSTSRVRTRRTSSWRRPTRACAR